jgi:AraC-like DNA-binding protein
MLALRKINVRSTSSHDHQPLLLEIGMGLIGTNSQAYPSPACAIIRKHLPVLFAQRGLSFSGFFSAYGLDARLLADEDRVPTHRCIADLLQKAAEFAAMPHLGLVLGQEGGIHSLGEAGPAIAQAPTLRQALATLERAFGSHDRGAIVDLTVGQVTSLRYILLDPAIDSGAVISDLAIALAARVLDELCGRGWRPELVELPRRAPADRQPYRSQFPCRIAFDAAGAAIHFDAADLDRPLVRRVAGAGPGAGCPAPRSAAPVVSARVIEHLTRGLATGALISAERVAGQLGMGSRTLQRELTKIHTSYRSLSDEVRFGISRRLLRDTDMTVTEIALVLGYADTSVLTRAFTRWAGTCPSEWRSLAGSGRRPQPGAERPGGPGAAPLAEPHPLRRVA